MYKCDQIRTESLCPVLKATKEIMADETITGTMLSGRVSYIEGWD